jgi:hypothetical protein
VNVVDVQHGVSIRSEKVVFKLSWTLSIDDPVVGVTRVHVKQTAIAAADVALEPLENVAALYGPQMSSMYKSDRSFDANIIVSESGAVTSHVGQLRKSPAKFNPTLPWRSGHFVRLDKDAPTSHNVLGITTSLTPL